VARGKICGVVVLQRRQDSILFGSMIIFSTAPPGNPRVGSGSVGQWYPHWRKPPGASRWARSYFVISSVDFAGKYYQVRDCEITPRGPRGGGPPVLIGGLRPRMLSLAARYADMWNPVAYLNAPGPFAEPHAKLRAACLEVGRDPTTLGLTALVALAYPDLGEPSPSPMIPAYLSGATEDIAAAMHSYEQMGVSHLMFHCAPYTAVALERLAEAVQVYRRQGAGN
jgi:alkanesulfonate monooxygenase SsuD/methylene tetrahydromethanopterin reductase-like flavin-dependent oxidoreductase (luciferase family)